MKKIIDLTGKTFGSLHVIKHIPVEQHGMLNRTYWLCECACGRHLLVRSDNLRAGLSTTCSDCRTMAGRLSWFVEGVTDDGKFVHQG